MPLPLEGRHILEYYTRARRPAHATAPIRRSPTVSTLTLGGGLGILWGWATFNECVASVHAAVAAGITLMHWLVDLQS